MQPTYLPWYGYFGLIENVDIFVFLNDVQFEKRSWQSRNYIKSGNKKLLLTVDVKSKNKFEQLIMDVEMNNFNETTKKHLRAIELNYKKTKYFNKYFPDIRAIYLKDYKKLTDLNENLIKKISNFLGIKTKIINSSSLNLKTKELKKDLYLFKICEKLSAQMIINPQGSEIYMSKSKIFLNQNIKVKYYKMNNFTYLQANENFIPNLSILDILFNEGNESINIINKNFSIYD
jgi:hypothetical protein